MEIPKLLKSVECLRSNYVCSFPFFWTSLCAGKREGFQLAHAPRGAAAEEEDGEDEEHGGSAPGLHRVAQGKGCRS